jgi:hypothetical protein
VEILSKASDFGIADVGTVQERREVKQTKPRYQLEIELPDEFAILNIQLAGHRKQVKQVSVQSWLVLQRSVRHLDQVSPRKGHGESFHSQSDF